MAVKDDYIMRMIEDMARVLARLILGKDDINYVLPEDEKFTATHSLYKKLITMADEGQDVYKRQEVPQTKWVEGSNFVDVNFKIDPRTNRIVMMGAMDNLVKGAAGPVSYTHLFIWKR